MKTHWIKESSTLATLKIKSIEMLNGKYIPLTDAPLYNLYDVKSVLMYNHKKKEWIKFIIIHKAK